MKVNLQQAIISKTKEVLKESQDLQIDFKANLKNKVSRQAKYIDPSISEDQIKEICNDPEVQFFPLIYKVFSLERRAIITGKNVRNCKYSITECCF